MTTGFPATAWFYWIGGALLASIGLWLLYWSLLRDRSHGRRRCPRCWYDMSGTPEISEKPGQFICSECGMSITRERKLHKTRRRWRWAMAAALLMILGPGSALFQTWNLNWNTIKPLWWLLRQGRIDSSSGTAARVEVVSRIQNKLLTDSQIQSAVEYALAIQAEPSAFWMNTRQSQFMSTWGDVVEEAWSKGQLSKEQIEKYVRCGFGDSFSITARSRIRQGAPFPVRFRSTIPRLSQRDWAFNPQGTLLVAIGSPTNIDGADFQRGWPATPYTIGNSGSPGWETSPLLTCSFPPGVHAIRMDWEFGVFRHTRGQPMRLSQTMRIKEYPDLLAYWTKSYVLSVEVLEQGAEVIKRIPDESLRATIQNAMRLEFVQEQIMIDLTTYHGPNGMILIDPLPIAVAFDVYCRALGREEKIGEISSPAGRDHTDNAQRIDRDPRLLFPTLGAVDVILRASAIPAERTVDINDIWDGEIVFENVPIREVAESDAASRPGER